MSLAFAANGWCLVVAESNASTDVECHSKVDKGSVIEGTEFGGGREFTFPSDTSCYTANITPDKETGIGKWSKESFI